MGRDDAHDEADGRLSDGVASLPVHDLIAGVKAVTEAAERVLAAAQRTWSLSGDEAREAVEALCRSASTHEAARLAVLKVLDDQPEAVSGAATGKVAATFLTGRMHADPATAHRDVRTARALDPETGTLPHLGAALAAGEISREHADVCVRAVARLPRRLTRIHVVWEPTGETVTGLELADRWLTDQCRRHPVRAVSRLAEELVRLLDPDREERFDEDAHLRRSVSFVRDSTGMGQLRVQLTPADTVVVEVLLAALGKPEPRRDVVTADESGAEQLAVVRDERTAPMRKYDGLLALLRGEMSGDGPRAGTLQVGLLVTATLDQVAAAGVAAERSATQAGPDGRPLGVPGSFGRAAGQAYLHRSGPVGAHLLGYLACCATVTRILLDERGSPLDVGRTHRLATPAQRKALAVRDGGCVIPGCACPVQGTDAHHVVAWQAGGATSLANLVLLCAAHHQLVHAGVWQVEVHDGQAHARPPSWIDPERRWLRNALHRSHQEAQEVGAQLRLALDTDANRATTTRHVRFGATDDPRSRLGPPDDDVLGDRVSTGQPQWRDPGEPNPWERDP